MIAVSDNFRKEGIEMGVVKTIGYDRFPKQGDTLKKRVKVCFNFETDRVIDGTIVRDDIEEPYVTLILLDDGRIVRSTECQYTDDDE